MPLLPDVNVLLPALRADDPHHLRLRGWLERSLESSVPLALCPQILSAVIRLATSPRVYRRPTELGIALAFADALLEHRRTQVVRPGSGHWSILRQLCVATHATGKLIPDAVNAALAIEHGCTFVTRDRDYRRFEGLRWCDPLEDLEPGGYYVMEQRGAYAVPVRHSRKARRPVGTPST